MSTMPTHVPLNPALNCCRASNQAKLAGQLQDAAAWQPKAARWGDAMLVKGESSATGPWVYLASCGHGRPWGHAFEFDWLELLENS